MEFRILGPLEAVSDGRALDLGGAKQRALLAALLVHANEVVSPDQLIDALWGEAPPETARKAVQVYISQLRKLLGPGLLVTRPAGYVLQLEPGMLDLDRFEVLRREAREAGPSAAAAKLRQGLALFRGRPLADFAGERFAQAEIARIEELQLIALEERIDAELRLGQHAELVGELDALVAEHPLRDRLCRQRMLALYRCGRQAEALDTYQAARRALVEELGIEPSRELRELHQAILRQDAALDREAPEPAEPAAEAPGGFVGRESELAELTAGLDGAFAGRGWLFLLQGEPGIGKSRLAEELMRRAQGRGARVLVGRCWEAGGAPAYWPWTQSLRVYVRDADPAALRRQLGPGVADVALVVPQLRDLFSGLPAHEPAESEAARFRLFDSTASFLVNAAAERPLVLVLDDLHAADEPSLLLLQYVASVLGDSRVLIVGAFRDVDPTVSDPLESTLAELGREPVTRRIHLAGLSREEVGWLAELTSSARPSKRLVATLQAETEGNPLFVSEIVRLLAAEGRLGADAQVGIPIPESVREAIVRRLRRLSGECRRVLSLASVFGREFGLVALERVADYTGIDKLLGVLDEALAARVVEEMPGAVGRLRFGHALTRDTLYEEIPATHRARLHRRVGEVLEALYAGNPDPHLAELAHHFSLAVPAAAPEKAIEYARRAGDRALAFLAYEEAARLYVTALAALDVAETADQRARCALLISLGEAQARAGDISAAKEVFLDAADIARGLGLTHELARAAAGYGGRHLWGRAGNDHRLVPLLEEGLAALTDQDVELRVRLLARLAGALRDEHSRERREQVSAQAVELARRTGNPAVIGYALDGRAAAMLAPDTVEERLALGRELCELGERSGDTERVVHGHVYVFYAAFELGDLQEATANLEAAGRIAEELRQPAQLWWVWAGRAALALAAGELAGAAEGIERALALGERAEPPAAIACYRLQRYALCDLRGSVADVEPAINESVTEYPARPIFRCVLAHLAARLGRPDEAQRKLEDLARDEFAALPLDMEWLYAMSLLAETAVLLGNLQSAVVLYRLLAPWDAFNAADAPEGTRGSVSRYLGLLATALERWEDATRHFEQALAMNARIGARPWLAHTEEDYARMLLARNVPGDADRAGELLKDALMTYRELGMDSYAARAAELVEEAAVSTP